MSTSRSLQGGVPFQANPSMNDGRIGVHATDSLGEGTSVGTIYFHRHKGDKIALYDGTNWALYTIADTPALLALSGGTASLPHDVWAYASGTTVTLEITAWTSATARATAIVMQDGVWSKTGTLTRRYLGTIYLDGSKQTTDNITHRLVWNISNRVSRHLFKGATGTWTYTTVTWRQANADTTNKIVMVRGLDADSASVTVKSSGANSTNNITAAVGVGIDTSTANSAQTGGSTLNATSAESHMATYVGLPGIGYRELRWLEISAATGVSTWNGTNGVQASGISGTIRA